MKNIIICLGIIVIIPICIAGEWPVYKPATIHAERAPSNPSFAELNPIRVQVNDKVDLIFESWTINIISDNYFEFWRDSEPQFKEIGKITEKFQSTSGYLINITCEDEIAGDKCIFAVEWPEENDRFYITIESNGEPAGKLTGSYCEFRGGTPTPFQNYHTGIDIGDVENLAQSTPTSLPTEEPRLFRRT
jgi:hypothetical protein